MSSNIEEESWRELENAVEEKTPDCAIEQRRREDCSMVPNIRIEREAKHTRVDEEVISKDERRDRQREKSDRVQCSEVNDSGSRPRKD